MNTTRRFYPSYTTEELEQRMIDGKGNSIMENEIKERKELKALAPPSRNSHVNPVFAQILNGIFVPFGTRKGGGR